MTTGEIPVLTFAQVAVASARERQARKSRRQPASSIGWRNRARSLRQDPCAPRLNRRSPWGCRYRPSRRSRGRASASRRHSADLCIASFPSTRHGSASINLRVRGSASPHATALLHRLRPESSEKISVQLEIRNALRGLENFWFADKVPRVLTGEVTSSCRNYSTVSKS